MSSFFPDTVEQERERERDRVSKIQKWKCSIEEESNHIISFVYRFSGWRKPFFSPMYQTVKSIPRLFGVGYRCENATFASIFSPRNDEILLNSINSIFGQMSGKKFSDLLLSTWLDGK